jgi:ABC-type branched-subunit amino acid transport system substrate-binding protein
MLKRSAFFLVCSLMAMQGALFAQRLSHTDYLAAVESYKKGQYEVAFKQLAPFTSYENQHPSAPYAHYYYALSAYQLNKLTESRTMLMQLMNRFPNWPEQNELNYLMGATYLKGKNWSEGFRWLDKVTDASFAKSKKGLKSRYLAEVTDIRALEDLYNRYPDDIEVAEAFVSLIQRTSTDRKYLALSDQISNKLGNNELAKPIASSSNRKQEVEKKWDKGFYTLSVLLPFRLSEVTSEKNRSNQFAYDLFQGMNLAKQKLKNDGILVNINAFDVSNNRSQMEGLLNNTPFKQSDALIGPLYAETFELAAAYSTASKTLLINPLSTDGSLLKDHPYVYLAQPAIDQQMAKVLDLALKQNPNASFAVYYGTTPKDSLMAVSLLAQIRSKNRKTLEQKKLSGTQEQVTASMGSFTSEKPSHVILLTSNPAHGRMLMVAMGAKKLTAQVIATSQSFDFAKTRPSSYNGRLFLLAPDYVDTSKELTKSFQLAYYEQYSTLPSTYSYLGYDLVLHLGRLMHRYKDRVFEALAMQPYKDDFLLQGFDFTKNRDNTVSAILKHDGQRWVLSED